MPKRLTLALAAALFGLALTGCGKDEPKSSRTPEQEQSARDGMKKYEKK